ncbi:hypothetical protein MYSTI_06431 [Myxococcus stipitatus DSM 14675]|uniref:Lipase modulator n=1 Tax=Myxococcus stipitatus (strain DSM 14675 / JCM 12634 / Mx s8) TaxID=1278073 RepID=L7UMK3_MYXSD|nr:hypothetical protein [Myxococcus stipitatus]AGC47704.1 hypothetical protein MYSTI_06431 [Myxococcus stipitatus DSM 14675]
MTRRTKVLLGGAVVALLVAVGVLRFTRAEAPGPDASAPVIAGASAPAPSGVAPVTPTGAVSAPVPAVVAPASDAELEELAAVLRERYGAKLDEPYVQMRFVEELMRFFQQRSPDRWREELLAFVKEHFPERYDALEAMLRNRVDYEKWVRDNDSYLRGLSDAERRAATWDARNRLFGKETAERIWAAELKNQALADSLRSLDARDDLSLEKKLSTFKKRIQEVHGEKADAYLARHQQEVMNHFLDLSSVQTELGGMTPQARSQSLRSMRRELGLDEEALKRWDTLDQSRDARWDTGAKYMAERQTLAKELSGEALEARLAEVRARYFGGEADTIAQEEASGFYRFERPRQWGRN